MSQGQQLRREIHEQPAALARLLQEGRACVEDAAERIRAAQPGWVLIAARGSSDNAARYAQYLLGAQHRLAVGLAVPSLITLYDAPPAVDGALVVGISQSGQSPDIVSVLAEARKQGATTLALTNEPASPLALAANLRIPLSAGPERAVAATKTYTNQLLALAMLSTALGDDESAWDELERLPGWVEQTLGLNKRAAEAVAPVASSDRLIVVGRGFNYCTAFEVALKLKETSYVVAEPYSVADLLHGPVALLERGFPVLLVAPTGRAFDDAWAFMQLAEQRGAATVVLSDAPELRARGAASLAIPPGIPEWLSPIVAVVAGQLWCLELALARGLDPDSPRGLSKVTMTL